MKKILGTVSLVAALHSPALATQDMNRDMILEAGDKRDVKDLADQVEAGNLDAIRAVGQSFDFETCKKLTGVLSSEETGVRLAAARAVGHCGDTSLAQWLRYRLRKEDNADARGELAYSLGLLGLESDRDYLATLVNNSGDERTIQALLQSVAYASLKASDLPGLDLEKLLAKVTASREGDSSSAAYLLARLGGLHRVVDFPKIEAALQQAGSEHAKILLATTLASYGDQALPLLTEYANSGSANMRAAVAGAFVNSDNPAASPILAKLASDDASRVRKNVAAALANLESVSPEKMRITHLLATDSSPWVQMSGLGALYRHDQPAGLVLARTLMRSENLYLKAAAVRLLGDDEASKATIQAMADNDAEPYLQGAAKTALEIEQETPDQAAQPTPGYADALAATEKHLVLETTRGRIVIDLSPDTPFAAWNFVQLADFGHLENIMWHRVIPNFVAQAGARNDEERRSWGTIREEWGSSHKPYSVGVATAGPDTGSRQFFINTRHNLHLDNRYTVFGHVIEGFEVVDALEEGDWITRADAIYPD